MKKALSLLLASALLLGTAAALPNGSSIIPQLAITAQAETIVSSGETDEFKYDIIRYGADGSKEYVRLKKYKKSATDVVVPSTIEGRPVRELYESVFKGKTKLKSVVIPEGVVEINNYCFSGCTALVSIKLPSTLTYCGHAVFNNCKSLKEIELPDSLDTLGCGEMFSLCSKLEKVKLPAQLLQIDTDSFWKCESLKTIDIPETVTRITGFADCSSLESITIPQNVTSLGIGAFERCVKLTSIDIPKSVKTIKYYCFYDCTGLTSVTLREGLETIELETFVGCTKLKEIVIPYSVTKIGDHAFGFYKDGQNYVKLSGAKIYGYPGTAAQKYAKKNGIKFVSIAYPGDANTDDNIDITDIMLMQQHIAGWDTNINTANADYDGDGEVTIQDVMYVQQRIAGWFKLYNLIIS